MSRYSLFDRRRIRLAGVSTRESDVTIREIAKLPESFSAMTELSRVIDAMILARRECRPVIAMFGGHPVKLGLSRLIISLIESGWITCIATNGAGLIHDFELATFGATSEDVSRWITRGQFGLWTETDELNSAIQLAADRNEGMGEGVGRFLCEESGPKHPDVSIAVAAWKCGIPMTCHVSIGSDIFHGYPNCDGRALGQTSHTDFLIYAEQIRHLEGGVFLNIGSAVTGPEVYLKALSMARNVAIQDGESITDFTTAVFDVVNLPDNWMDGPGRPPQGKDADPTPHPLYYFRPWKTILCRTIQDGGTSFYVKGDHRDTIPALWHGLSKYDPPRSRTTNETG